MGAERVFPAEFQIAGGSDNELKLAWSADRAQRGHKWPLFHEAEKVGVRPWL